MRQTNYLIPQNSPCNASMGTKQPAACQLPRPWASSMWNLLLFSFHREEKTLPIVGSYQEHRDSFPTGEWKQ
jgi:hypothetical protein